ncbi:MAG TPA: NYN domain-containing protein, partial [Streptosporangiaceae bacterium]|nr:NYN domain-containing protein [Streptosporangiaceae bacterium]
ARFTAAKRARLGGSAIATALDGDPGFRRRVLDAARMTHPGLVEALSAGPPPPAADPADVAVVAYLLRADGWAEIVAAAAAEIRRASEDEQATRADVTTVRLREQLAAARAEAREDRARSRAESDRLKVENAALRRQANQARADATRADEAGQAKAAAAARSVELAESARASAEAEARRLRGRLAEVEEALSSSRRAGREGRSLETARLGLLLDTLAEAAAGLRRELALPVATSRPADTVDAAAPAVASAQRRPGDSASLDDLLTLPRCHLVVDGYNVTKGAWASIPLEAQRTRLVQRLGVLAARTGAEVTCVFDGADVSVPPPVTPAQGVRVLFSPQGQSADELIRRLVAAEPPGRAVIVVSSDREVADGVRSSGAWAVDSDLLVPLLG